MQILIQLSLALCRAFSLEAETERIQGNEPHFQGSHSCGAEELGPWLCLLVTLTYVSCLYMYTFARNNNYIFALRSCSFLKYNFGFGYPLPQCLKFSGYKQNHDLTLGQDSGRN